MTAQHWRNLRGLALASLVLLAAGSRIADDYADAILAFIP